MQQEQPEILRLVAQDEADIEVVSALLQDRARNQLGAYAKQRALSVELPPA